MGASGVACQETRVSFPNSNPAERPGRNFSTQPASKRTEPSKRTGPPTR